jgi:hypothetical protein
MCLSYLESCFNIILFTSKQSPHDRPIPHSGGYIGFLKELFFFFELIRYRIRVRGLIPETLRMIFINYF